MKWLCWACITGQCKNTPGHDKHRTPGEGDGGTIEAVTMTGGTPLCKDCARWRSTSEIGI